MSETNTPTLVDSLLPPSPSAPIQNGCQQEVGDETGTTAEVNRVETAQMGMVVEQPKQQQDTSMSSAHVEQTGKVFVGEGAKREAQLIGIGLGKLRASQLDDLHRAEQYAMDQSVKYVMLKQQQARLQHQQKAALYSQALSLMSRIYVGSINFDVFEDQIRDAFTVFGPIKTINMAVDPSTNHHKGFCFIEYEIPEAANIARDAMNGRMFGGRNLKVLPVGRQDTMPQAQPIIDMVVNEALQYNRIFVSSVHPDISEQDLRSVLMAFGEVTKCQLARHPSGKGHRGFGYIEFKAAGSVKEAIEGMNGFDLGGQFLQVGRAVAPPDAINYLSTGGKSSDSGALPAAAAIAAAEATARITAQEILGIGKTSPAGSSSPAADRTSASPTPPPSDSSALLQQPSTAEASAGGSPARATTTTARRRGFGGFAPGSSVPPPTVVKALTAPSLASAQLQQLALPAEVVKSMPTPQQQLQQQRQETMCAPQLVIPKLGGNGNTSAPIAAPVQTPAIAALAAEEAEVDPTIDDFYSTLKDAAFAAPKPLLVQPTLLLSSTTTTAFKSQQKSASSSASSAPIALPSSLPSTSSAAVVHPPKAAKPKKEKLDILDRIGAKAQIGTFDASAPASFAPLDPKVAPRDPNAVGEDDEEGAMLAIGGPEAWYALALRDGGGIVSKKGGDGTLAKNKQGGKGGKSNDPNAPKRKRTKKAKLSSGPKLNTAQKIAAANLAGALSDQLSSQNAQNDEATLASQEHVQIRGNDARHLLIQKLMRTNRSAVVVLRNMITPEGIDDALEDEIREECSKYGCVTDVVIVQEQETHTVKIFVRFAEPVQAEEARKAIDGRYFDGRTVSAESYDQTLFDHDDFTG